MGQAPLVYIQNSQCPFKKSANDVMRQIWSLTPFTICDWKGKRQLKLSGFRDRDFASRLKARMSFQSIKKYLFLTRLSR